MKQFLVVFIFFFLSFDVACQNKHVSYNKADLEEVVKEVENYFSIRFSYNDAIFKSQYFTYKGLLNLDIFLLEIELQNNINSEFIDAKNIVLTTKQQTISNYTLDEVLVVSEYLTSGFNQNEEDGSIVLSPTKMGVLPGLVESDVMQSLQLLPGISSPTESATNLHIRGGTPDQNLILWDGIKMYHQGHLFGMISAFNPYITERVDIYKSGASSKYGNRISGIIDMHSATDIFTKTAAGIGSNLLHSDAFLKLPIIKNELGIFIAARRSLTDVFNSITYRKLGNKIFQNTKIEDNNQQVQEEELRILKDQFYFVDFNAKATWRISEKHQLNFSSLFVRNKLDYANANLEGMTSNDRLNLQNNGFSLQSDNWLTKNFKLTTSINYSDYKSDSSLLETNTEDNGSYNRTNSVQDFGIIVASEVLLNSKNKLIFGADYADYDVAFTIDFVDATIEDEIQNNTLHTTSLYAEHVYNSSKWHIRSGARMSILSKLNTTFFEPRFYADYQINPVLKLKGSGEIKNQSISQLITFEFDELGLDNNTWTLANDSEIPVLNNHQLTGGFLYDKNNWKVDVEGYYKYTKGLTTFTRGFTNATNEDYFSGQSTSYGIDILVKKRIHRFRTWLSYSLSKTLFNFGALQASNFPGNFDQRHVISFSNTYKLKQFQFSLGWHFATGKPYAQPSGTRSFVNVDNQVENALVYDSQNNARLANYHRLDASIIYDFKLGKHKKTKARLGLSFLNVYNQENEIDKSSVLEGDTTQIIEETVIGLRTTPNILFRVSF
ncbi:TonB-dependent receptor plug domain-containing protein [Tenacibaculum amylolyticum]|uniref:TonB-dependent receptor plug domain-containing protein n=1 Tax=Tenacibaculum amylolyticum TaxID=104269 RepID=UPI0038952EFE